MALHTILSLPQCVVSEIVCGWIERRDQVRLDSAVCSTVVRPMILDIISSPQFTIRRAHELNTEESDKLVAWAYIRNARVSSICLGRHSDHHQYEQYSSTRWISFCCSGQRS